MENSFDIISYQGEDYEVESGLAANEVVEALRSVIGGLPNAVATYTVETNSDGQSFKRWRIQDQGGTKG